MNLTEFIGRLLSLKRPWKSAARNCRFRLPGPPTPAWLLFGCLALAAVAVLFYTRYQYAKRAKVRFFLAILRAALLSLLLVILAEPVLTIRITSQLRPSLWLLFDGTDSMGIADDLPEGERTKLAEAVGLPAEQAAAAASADPSGRPSRIDYVKALLEKKTENLVVRLQEKFRLKAFLFDRPDGVQGLEAASGGDGRIDGKRIADQLTTKGQVTALGAALGGPGPAARHEQPGRRGGLQRFQLELRPAAHRGGETPGTERLYRGCRARDPDRSCRGICMPAADEEGRAYPLTATVPGAGGPDGPPGDGEVLHAAAGGERGSAAVEAARRSARSAWMRPSRRSRSRTCPARWANSFRRGSRTLPGRGRHARTIGRNRKRSSTTT